MKSAIVNWLRLICANVCRSEKIIFMNATVAAHHLCVSFFEILMFSKEFQFYLSEMHGFYMPTYTLRVSESLLVLNSCVQI